MGPGSGVVYPEHLCGIYEQVSMEFLDMPLEHFHKSAFLQLEGSYRPAVVKPIDLEWNFVESDQVRELGELLQASDADRLLQAVVNRSESTELSHANNAEYKGSVEHAKPPSLPDDAAIVLRCMLPPSVYVTMLLREITFR